MMELQTPVAPRGTALRTHRESLSSGIHLGAGSAAFLQPLHRRELGLSLGEVLLPPPQSTR